MANKEDPRRFLDPRTISKIAHLELQAAQVVEGFINGMHRSKFFGHSVDFVQHREYVRGDDIRHLDWKVWSKTDRFYIKQFEAETNLRCQLVLDVSESMHYGAGNLNKYEYACTAAACIAYLLIRQQDSVGITTFDSEVRAVVPPRASQKHLEAICQTMHVSKPRDKTDMLKILNRVAEATHQRGIVAVISDCLTDREPLLKGLDMLRLRKQDVMLFHLLDDDELNFPFNGMTRFEGMEELPNLFCDPKALREGYLEELNIYLTEMRQGCTKRGIDYTLLKTSDPLDAVLAKFLHQRLDPRAKARTS
ncbi:DUF58 domain-containing protein [Telmatocola sphagniphila]|jgi:uncharacterized protein (DUF58 family)|uniref:DUF58 domain-containing protein n=1 Tax=Telmatocola sphagniphila TaxID=1123043 RepID=A0A8E6F0N0_9BACT|nr:DUF58 domain-containing protein [Telmatocola sphagniphila]QVL34721.1 DUF58 domain-containing protein [Telmatocola sphagniphila]